MTEVKRSGYPWHAAAEWRAYRAGLDELLVLLGREPLRLEDWQAEAPEVWDMLAVVSAQAMALRAAMTKRRGGDDRGATSGDRRRSGA